jgi:hypothetical protein
MFGRTRLLLWAYQNREKTHHGLKNRELEAGGCKVRVNQGGDEVKNSHGTLTLPRISNFNGFYFNFKTRKKNSLCVRVLHFWV